MKIKLVRICEYKDVTRKMNRNEYTKKSIDKRERLIDNYFT